MHIDEAYFTALLEARREELKALIHEAEGGTQPVALDQQSVGRLSRMDAMQVQAMAQASQRQRRQELRAIDAALERLANGEYGECVRCGEDIAPKRLTLNPTVQTCIHCASGK